MLTPGPYTCMTMGLHACQYCTSMHLQWYNTQHCMNGEADNSRMYLYMHLAFKELRALCQDTCNHLVLRQQYFGGGGIYWQPCTQGIEGKVYMCYACVCE